MTQIKFLSKTSLENCDFCSLKKLCEMAEMLAGMKGQLCKLYVLCRYPSSGHRARPPGLKKPSFPAKKERRRCPKRSLLLLENRLLVKGRGVAVTILVS